METLKTTWKVTATTLVIGIAAFMLAPAAPLGQQIWPAPYQEVETTGMQTGLFLLLGAVEAFAFGLAVAFLVFGWRATKRVVGEDKKGLAVAVHVSVFWLFGNFWLHDNLHMLNGTYVPGLLAIDYLFHIPIIAAGVIMAYALVHIARDRMAASDPEPEAAPGK